MDSNGYTLLWRALIPRDPVLYNICVIFLHLLLYCDLTKIDQLLQLGDNYCIINITKCIQKEILSPPFPQFIFSK